MSLNTFLPPSPGSLIQNSSTKLHSIPLKPVIRKEDTSTAHAKAILIKEIKDAGGELDVYVTISSYANLHDEVYIRLNHSCKLIHFADKFYIVHPVRLVGNPEGKAIHKFEANADLSLPFSYLYFESGKTLELFCPYIASASAWSRVPSLNITE